MIGFILLRIGQGIVIALIPIAFVFVATRATGDPLSVLLPMDAPADLRNRMAEELGLNWPLIAQYFIYLGQVFRGDLGTSFRYGVPVAQLFFDRLPNSLALVVPAFIIAWIISVPLAVVAATTRHRWLDKALSVLAALALAAPVFWIGVVFILIFSVALGWLPSSRMGGIDHYVLPVTTLVLFVAAGLMRLVRSSMLESMGSEFVKLPGSRACPNAG